MEKGRNCNRGIGAGGGGGGRLDATGGVLAYPQYILSITIWVLILLGASHGAWDGCFDGFKSINNTDFCYHITEHTSGFDAWEHCTSLKFVKHILNMSEYGEGFPGVAHIKDFLEEMGTRENRTMWVGAREEFSESHSFVAFDGSRALVNSEKWKEKTEQCLGIRRDMKDRVEVMSLDTYSCRDVMPALCVQTKFYGVVHNASQACQDDKRVTLTPFSDCFGIGPVCEDLPSSVKVLARPILEPLANFSRIARENPVPVDIIEMTTNETFTKVDSKKENITNFCSIEAPSSVPPHFELRYNQTAGGLILRVQNPGRSTWLPKCVGGHIVKVDDAESLLRVETPTSNSTPVVWCYAQDILEGGGIHSNRVLHPNVKRVTCPDTNNTLGPPPGTKVNHEASCLYCLLQTFRNCIVEDYCDELFCGDLRCGILRSFHEKEKLIMRESPERYTECRWHEECMAKALWLMTDSGDCNSDGVVDCDDRFARFFGPSCPPFGVGLMEDVRRTYWSCRHSSLREFVDLKQEINTTRFVCSGQEYGNRSWKMSEIFDDHTIYTLPRLFETPPDNMTEEAATKAFVQLRKLEEERRALSMSNMYNALIQVSNLLQLQIRELHNAQRAANASLLPILMENIVLFPPHILNITEDNVAISKTGNIGVQVLSDKPLRGAERRFGPFPRQIPIRNHKDVLQNENKIEAAVVLSGVINNVEMVVITYADGADFISSHNYAEMNIDKANLTAPEIDIDHSTNVSKPQLAVDVHEKDALEKGCLNSHVVGVSLINNNTRVPLPEGHTVNITFRTAVALLPGQKKHCVYWKHEEDGWATDGCRLVVDGRGSDSLDTCECDHLTHFAEMVTDGVVITGYDAHVLRLMSICSCALCLLGLSGIIFAGFFGQKWRKKPENKVLMNLAVAVSLSMAVFLWSSEQLKPSRNSWCALPDALCRVTGGALHFFVLAAFCWMLVAAGTHYARLTTVTGVTGYSHFVLKASLVGWGAPALPVAVLAAVDADAYAGRSREFCYPSGAAFYAAVLAPISLVLFLNLLLFVLIVRRLFPKCCSFGNVTSGLSRWGVDEKVVRARKAIICVAFTFLFGLTWYMGLLCYSVISAYIFNVVVALQGPALFLFFVLGEESVRSKLKSIRGRMFASTQDSTSASNVSSNRAGDKVQEVNF